MDIDIWIGHAMIMIRINYTKLFEIVITGLVIQTSNFYTHNRNLGKPEMVI